MRIQLVLLIFALASVGPGASAQSSGVPAPRTVQLEATFPNDLVRVVKIVANGREVAPGVPFPAGDDWFRGFSLVIKNISTKKIVFAAGQLRFPETGDAAPEHLAVMARISVGQRPEPARTSSDEGVRPDDVPSAPILVAPGQETTVRVVENFERVKTMIEGRHPLTGVTKCMVGLNTLYFGDGTEWQSGLYFRADPNTPGRYVRISAKEFSANEQEQHQ
jgi:hypothetical protein